MCFFGKLRKSKRGVGSIIGAAFVALILLSGFMFYAVTLSITEHYNMTVGSVNEEDWNRSREKIVFKSIKITSANKLNLTVENQGSVQSHIIWLGIMNKSASLEKQEYYALSEHVKPAETKSIISNSSIVKDKKYAVQLVTELGNVIENRFYPASAVKCSLKLVVAPPTVYAGNNATVFFTVTHNDTEVDTVQSLSVSLLSSPSGLVQLVDNSPLSVESLNRGETAFFWWTYKTTDVGTVTFNASYSQAPSGIYALSTMRMQVGAGIVTITGVNCTAPYNPKGWKLFGGTTYVSGSTSGLANNDTDCMVFRSYSSGSTMNLTLLNDGFEGLDWDENWDQYGVTNWVRTFSPVHSGTWSAQGTGTSTILTCDNLNTSGASIIFVEFWFMKEGIENNEFMLYYWDGTQYDLIQDLDLLGSDGVWLRYAHDITDPQYFRADFRIRFDCTPTSGSGENVWVDDVLIKKQLGLDRYTAEVEFTGSSNLQTWFRLIWLVDSCWDIGEANVTIQLYDFTASNYPSSGNGYISYVSALTQNTDELKSQTISSNLTDFRNSTGYWKIKIKGEKFTRTQFQLKVDWIETVTSYQSTGNVIPYNSWQWYTIKAASASGGPIPYGYVSIYANGTNVVFRNATDMATISNPGLVRLNAAGEFYLELKSANGTAQTFVLYAVVGSVVGEKTVPQEAP